MPVSFEIIDESAHNQRLDNFLIKKLKGVPKSYIYRIVRKGEVRVNKGRKNCSYKLNIGDNVRIPPVRVTNNKNIIIQEHLKQLITKSILYEDDGLVIINKPAKLAVHSGSGISIGVIDIIRQMYLKPVELVHRLDRATSGVLLIAKKRLVLKELNSQIANHNVNKNYIALVEGVWSKKCHTIDAPLLNAAHATIVDNDGKMAVSHFHPIKNWHNSTAYKLDLSLVNITIETGRTHQIRVHAAYAKHKIAGDEKYGNKILNKRLCSLGLTRLFLHAKKLVFTNPLTQKQQTIVAPMADDLNKFLQIL